MNEPDLKFKIVITGKNEVGKTSLVRMYVESKFSESYLPTLLTDFTVKNISYDGKSIRLMIYEIAGHKKYAHMQSKNFFGADCVCAVAAFDNIESIKNLPFILDTAKKHWEEQNKKNINIPFLIVVNKLDLVLQLKEFESILSRSEQMIKGIAAGYLLDKVIFTSAKTSKNVDTMFSSITSALMKAS